MYTKVAIAKKIWKYNIYIWNQHYVCWLTLLDAIVSEGLVMTRLGSQSSIIYAGAIWVYNFLPFSFILWYARIKFRFIVFSFSFISLWICLIILCITPPNFHGTSKNWPSNFNLDSTSRYFAPHQMSLGMAGGPHWRTEGRTSGWMHETTKIPIWYHLSVP